MGEEREREARDRARRDATRMVRRLELKCENAGRMFSNQSGCQNVKKKARSDVG